MLYIQSIDTKGLNAALTEMQPYSRRTPAQAVATAAYYIVKKATRQAPRASMSAMDAQLGAATSVRYTTKRGNRLLKRPARTTILAGNAGGGATLAEKIVLARMVPNSRYNVLTNNRWQIVRSTFSPGRGISGFWSKVLEVATDMVKARHSSIAFFASCLIPVIRDLEPFIDPRQRRRGGSVDPQVSKAVGGTRMGEAITETSGSTALVTVNLLIGVVSGPLNEIHNAAMRRIMTPVIQKCINDETEGTTAKAVAKEEMANRAARLLAYGVRVT